MKTIEYPLEDLRVSDLLSLAIEDDLLLKRPDGIAFILTQIDDDFDEEVKLLGNSARFMAFLEKRSKKKGRLSLEEVRKRLKLDEP